MGNYEQPTAVDATFYAQVEPKFQNWGTDASGNRVLDGARVVAITQQRPGKPKSGAVIVKLTIRVPTPAFLPLAPEAIVVVPAELTDRAPIDVTASDPHDYGHRRDGEDCAPEVCGGSRLDPCTYGRAEIVRFEAEARAELEEAAK
jgi:hypothetical protein